MSHVLLVDPCNAFTCLFLLDPYKLFEEFVTTPKEETGELPDKEEVLGRFYTLDLEKEGAIFILERLQKRQHQQELDGDQEEGEQDDKENKEETKVQKREDYEVMIQVLRDSLEREVVVAATLDDESSDSDSDSDDEEDDTDSDSDSDSVAEK